MIEVGADGASYRNDATLSGNPALKLSGRAVSFTNGATGSLFATGAGQPALLITGTDASVVNLAGGVIANYEGAAILNASGPGQTIVPTLQNFGTIIGTVTLSEGRDSYLEAGIHIGRVDLRGGDDVMELRAFNGPIEGGGGTDTLILATDLLSTGVTGFETLVLRAGALNIFYLSGLGTVTLAAGASHNFVEAVNPLADLTLAGGYVTVGRDSAFRSVTGSDARDVLEINRGSVFGDVRLGGGDDSLTYSLNDFGIAPARTQVLGGMLDGGTGYNSLGLAVDGGRTVDAAMFTNFQSVDTGGFTSIVGDMTLVNLNGYRDIYADEGRLTLERSSSPEARLRIQNNGTVTIGAESVIGRIGDDAAFDGPLPGFAFTQTIVNRGTVLGDVRLYIGNETYDGRAGTVGGTIYGDQGDDTLLAGRGDDRLSGGAGSDLIDGGDGVDTLLLGGAASDYSVTAIAGGYLVRDGFEVDRVVNVERVGLGGAPGIAFADFEARSFDPYAYLAAHADLRTAFGNDPVAARAHYLANGRAEGRDPGLFDGRLYAASNPDLARLFGLDGDAATSHYLAYGIAEGRPTASFDPLRYAASNPDVARRIGADANALLRDYLETGADAGRRADAFDALSYAAVNPDLARAFGGDVAALTRHYVAYGIQEGRSTQGFDAIEYAASNPDLAAAFGTNVAALTRHYVEYGVAEGRVVDSFDALLYAATNVDVARVFGDDEAALERHYIEYGIGEGRAATGFDAVAYLLSNPDLGRAGLRAGDALDHWIDNGIAEGRIGDGLFGREQASHAAAVGGTSPGTIDRARDRDWYAITLHAGETVRLDLAGDQRGDPRGFGLPDPLMTLYDASGRVIEVDDNSGPGRDASIRYTATADGLFYVEAAGANAFGFFDVGGYTLSVASETLI